MQFHINKNVPKNSTNLISVIFKEVKKEKFEVMAGQELLVLKKIKELENCVEDNLREKIYFIRNIIRVARQYEIKNLEINFQDLLILNGGDNFVEFIATNMLMANYEFETFKTKKENKYTGVENIYFTNVEKINENFFSQKVKIGEIIGVEVNNAREISNLPANVVYPESLSEYVKSKVQEINLGIKKVKVSLKVLNKKDLQKLGVGGILAVAAGSQHEPKLIVLEYFGSKNTSGPVLNKNKNKTLVDIDFCFVGKGVTHDNGGINIKPSSGGSLEEMHMDMSGGSAVIHTFFSLVKLGMQKNIIAIVPAVENSISGESYRPGDIIKMMSGKTVEVLNTDAEDRIILADALTYAQENFKCENIIDVATLTGAALVALGTGASVIMGNDKNLNKNLIEIGNEKTGDFLWELPLWNEYKKAVKNKRADIGNIPESNSRYGGVINAAMFLKEFIDKDQKWSHIDMAPRMTSTQSDSLATGAMGETVRLLVELVRKEN